MNQDQSTNQPPPDQSKPAQTNDPTPGSSASQTSTTDQDPAKKLPQQQPNQTNQSADQNQSSITNSKAAISTKSPPNPSSQTTPSTTQPTAANQQSTTTDQQPHKATDQQSASNNQPLASNNQAASTQAQQSATDNQTSVSQAQSLTNQSESLTPTPAPTSKPISPPTQAHLQPIITGQAFTDTFPKQPYKGPKPVILLILDGWGIGPNNAGNAIAQAKTPNMDQYWISFPHTQLAASGEAVGLPKGSDGNSETGHLNIGAGTIVYQDLPRINTAIADGSFNQNKAFHHAFNHVRQHNSTLHLMGLIGSGGVHSNIEHLYALLHLCKSENIANVYVHGFTDGRDSPPNSGINYVQQIMTKLQELEIGHLATLMGRYYAMDRDKRWERIEKAYHALTIGSGACTKDPVAALQAQYDKKITDEFIEPINVCNGDGSVRVIQDNDAVIFFNYRIDRPRELTRAFVMPDFEQGVKQETFDPYTEKYEKTNIQKKASGATFQRQKILHNIYFVTMTCYEEILPVDVAFAPQGGKDSLCKIMTQHGLSQLRITETEKERFVTYYMNGQQEELYPGEDRVIIPSKGVKSYDQAPEMSAYEIGQEMINRINQNKYDFILANICNGDMVGHTGNLKAGIKACEVVDEVVGQIVNTVLPTGGAVVITADHGNVEEMINNETGQVDTEHSIYPVPLIIAAQQYQGKATMLPTGILADVAPTVLKLMNISKPHSMTGRALL
ncbi:MAG: 2,3-bisphosphoglycerate-independent phosphoglycerate mutase [Candidatus Pacebacteria bacterium]|nr:2,3-bisphosphoglycerate-independent phosphoglycerate mutase [Candidatus Paceibacterota bacterium]